MFWWLLVTVRLMLAVPWLRFNRWLGNAVGRPAKLCVRVCVLGDGFAEGVGDWVTTGTRAGVQDRLRDLFRANPMIRLPVEVDAIGHWGATSEEWLPTHPTAPRMNALRWMKGTRLWRYFANTTSKLGPSDIVVMMLGGMDGSRHSAVETPEDTATNLLDVAETFLQDGVSVCVCTLPPSCPQARERNTSTIAALIKRKDAMKQSGQDADLLFLGPSVNALRDPSMYCFDGLHYSSKGYATFARQLADTLEQRVIRGVFRLAQSATSSR